MTAMTSVLIVDDEPAVRDLMARWVSSLGLRPKTAANADEALATLRREQCDLAVIDVMLPGHDGLWLASQLQRDHPQTAVVLATAYAVLLDNDDDDERPVADLLIKPFQRDRFALAVDRGRRWRKQTLDERRWHMQLSIELRDRIEQVCGELTRRSGPGTDEGEVLLAMAWEGTPGIAAHSERVARYAGSVAREMGCEDGELSVVLDAAARFHDIGKLAIPDALLTKPSPLAPGEDAIMRRHVDAGAAILASTRTLRDVAPIVFASHEWFGGGGYPRRLAGHAIPLASRIVAIADAYDAMTQDRQYRARFDSAEAITEILRCCPAQFDPEIVTTFLAVLSRH
ncbi:MAG TPA: HD domain-containing phosphohydrolase [Vicinamibacterales bacterium]|nr:HD domain-containing phosphohydrolase [Vicinamibacterales bacterium]